MQFKHIIFDLDGTLIDTENAVLRTWQFTLKNYNYDYSLDELKIVLGITMGKALEKLDIKIDDNFELNWVKNYRNFASQMMFFEGVREMLKALKEKEFSLGIVTSRSKKEYLDYFWHFHMDELFHTIVFADDTTKHKPDPQPLLKYVELAKADLTSCIYIGDMPTDIECANQAHMASGLVTWNESGVLCEKANYTFHKPDEIFDIL